MKLRLQITKEPDIRFISHLNTSGAWKKPSGGRTYRWPIRKASIPI